LVVLSVVAGACRWSPVDVVGPEPQPHPVAVGSLSLGTPTTTPLSVVRGSWCTHAAPEKWFLVLPRATNRAMSALSGGFRVHNDACGMSDP